MTPTMDSVLDLLRSMCNMRHVKLTNCGSSAILAALCAVKKANPKPFILIPDQGGWFTYETYSKLLNFEIKQVKTNAGIFDLEDLHKQAKTGAALLYSSLAGYCADQPMREIYEICKEAGCLVILDASGSFGTPGLVAGQWADLLVASFGKWKVVDLGYGGMVGAVKKEYLEENELAGILRHNIDLAALDAKLRLAGTRFSYLAGTCTAVKNDLAGHPIVHRGRTGIVVIVKFKSEEEKKAIIDYCTAHKHEYTICPRYIRVMEDAVSIEVKRLEGVGQEGAG